MLRTRAWRCSTIPFFSPCQYAEQAMATQRKVWPGKPYPLGATWDGKGVNFALFSAHAEKVELCLFDRSGLRMKRLARAARNIPTRVWHAYSARRTGRPALRLPRVRSVRSGQRASASNPNKLMIDPYRQVAAMAGCAGSSAVFGYRVGSPREDLAIGPAATIRTSSRNAGSSEPAFTWGEERRPGAHGRKRSSSELSVRGITVKRRPVSIPSIAAPLPGLASPAMIDYLVGLGVTAVELMPVYGG